MKKLILIFLIISLILLPSLAFAYNHYDYYGASQYENSYIQQYSNGNERLRLKTLADIQRSTKPSPQYDYFTDDYYICDWEYNKYLDTWLCKKDYGQAQDYLYPFREDRVCPYGYTLDYGQNNCVQIAVPLNAHLNSSGDGWECNAGYHLGYIQNRCDEDMYIQPISYQPVQPAYTQSYYENKHIEQWQWRCVEWEFLSGLSQCIRWDGYIY